MYLEEIFVVATIASKSDHDLHVKREDLKTCYIHFKKILMGHLLTAVLAGRTALDSAESV